MKYILLSITSFLAIFSLQAQSPLAVNFEKDTAQLGKIPMKDLEYRFKFQVAPGKSVKIKEVKPDCACAVASFPKERLTAEALGHITVNFSPYKPGPFEKLFEVEWEGSSKTSTLLLKGYVEPEKVPINLDFSQKWGSLRLRNRIVNLGNIADDIIVKQRVEIYNPNEFPISFKDSIIKPNYVETIFESKLIEPFSTGHVDIYYHSEMKNTYGYNVDNIEFFTDDIFNPSLELNISANIYSKGLTDKRGNTPQIWVNADTLSLGKVFTNGHFIVSFIVYNKGGKNLDIQRVVPAENCEIISIDKKSIKKDEYASIKVKVFDIAKKAGTQYRTLEVYSNDPFQPTLPLTIMAEVVK